MNRAFDAPPRFAVKGDASPIPETSVAHGPAKVIHLHGLIDGDASGRYIVSFRPVKRYLKGDTAGAAAHAHIPPRRFVIHPKVLFLIRFHGSQNM